MGALGRNELRFCKTRPIPTVHFGVGAKVGHAPAAVRHRQIGVLSGGKELPVTGAAGWDGLELDKVAPIPLVDLGVDVPHAPFGTEVGDDQVRVAIDRKGLPVPCRLRGNRLNLGKTAPVPFVDPGIAAAVGDSQISLSLNGKGLPVRSGMGWDRLEFGKGCPVPPVDLGVDTTGRVVETVGQGEVGLTPMVKNSQSWAPLVGIDWNSTKLAPFHR